MKKALILICLGFLFTTVAGQTNEDRTLQHNGVTRDYKVHLPPNYNSSNPLPLVINMHGLSGNINTHMAYSGFNTIADTGNFIVVYPQGLTGTTTWGVTATQWDAYFGTGTKDLEFLDTLIDRMYYDYNIDLSRVYSTGHSNGGYMSYRLACELSERIAAIASVGGAMTFQQEPNCNPSHPMPILQIHGTDDQTVFYGGIPLLNSSIPALMNFWKNLNNCINDSTVTNLPNVNVGDSCTAQVIDFANCDTASQVTLYKVINGGHSWPGAYPYPPLGNTCQDFNASSVIWNFFNKYQLDNPVMPEDTVEVNGMSDVKVADFDLNLNQRQLMIVVDNPNGQKVGIYDATGKMMTESQIKDRNWTYNMSGIPKGVYYVSVEGHQGRKIAIQ